MICMFQSDITLSKVFLLLSFMSATNRTSQNTNRALEYLSKPSRIWKGNVLACKLSILHVKLHDKPSTSCGERNLLEASEEAL